MPPWFIRLPARIKNGIAVRLNLLMPTNVLCAAVTTEISSGTVCRIAASAEIPIEYAIGTPSASRTNNTIRIITSD